MLGEQLDHWVLRCSCRIRAEICRKPDKISGPPAQWILPLRSSISTTFDNSVESLFSSWSPGSAVC
ncbi:hypothetical protein IG631_05315 [Alternaria alternata]|nr:hypothetical protein IG631_05315 [Alternaria alternata]